MSDRNQTTATPAAWQAAIALHRAVMSYKRARNELRRADVAGIQPRLQKAGDRVFNARSRMYEAAEAFANAA